MSAVGVTFVGTGDAFGSGGRLQTCIRVGAPGIRFAVDFGATSLVVLRRLAIDPNSIDAVPCRPSERRMCVRRIHADNLTVALGHELNDRTRSIYYNDFASRLSIEKLINSIAKD